MVSGCIAILAQVNLLSGVILDSVESFEENIETCNSRVISEYQ